MMLRLYQSVLFFSLPLFAQPAPPEFRSEQLELVEIPASPSMHQYTLTLNDRLRSRHFAFTVDRSVCKGDLFVNDQKLLSDDADEIFAFDRANRIRLEGCLERTPHPLALHAHPKVLIEHATAQYRAADKTLRLHFRLRNTLANSATVTLSSPSLPSWEPSFFLGPETSQTHTLFLRLEKYEDFFELSLTKFEEALEGSYRHRRILPVTR